MIKIKCSKCNRTWQATTYTLDNIYMCPFCGEKTKGQSDIEIEAKKALKEITDTYGREILEDHKRAKAFLMDYLPTYPRERNIIVSALKEGVGRDLIKVLNKSDNEQKQMVTRCSKQLVEDIWVPEEAAFFAVSVIAFSLNIQCEQAAANTNNAGKTGADRGGALPKEDRELTGGNIGPDTDIKSVLRKYTVIGYMAFASFRNLQSFDTGESIRRIKEEAFLNCINLRDIVIGRNVEEIAENAFDGCINIKNITVSSENKNFCVKNDILIDKANKKTIKAANKGTRRIFIPEEAETICEKTFENSPYTSIYISKYVSNIHKNAFFGCSKLENIDVDIQNRRFCSVNGMLFSKDKKRLIMYPIGRRDTGFYYYVNNDVTEIGECAFRGAVNLTDVILNNKIKEIGKSAFECCSGLKTVTLPYTLERIGSSAFLNCKSLEKAVIHDNVKSIGDRAFDNCSSRLKVIINDNAYVEEYCKIRGIQIEKAGAGEQAKPSGNAYEPKQTTAGGNKFTIDNASKWIIGIYTKNKEHNSDKINTNDGLVIMNTAEAKMARGAFGIPKNENIFFIANCDPFGTLKVNSRGLVMASTGIYFRDENRKAGCIDWEHFANCRLSLKNGTYAENGIYISEYRFVSDNEKAVYQMLLTLQHYINTSLQAKRKQTGSSGNTSEVKPSPKPAAENIPKTTPAPEPAPKVTPSPKPASNNTKIAIDRIGQGIINIYFKNITSENNKIKINNGLPIVNTTEERIARMAFGIPIDKKIFFIANCNLISSFNINSKGFVLASTGIYLRDEHKKTGYISWEGFADCHIYLRNGLYISTYFFILLNDKAVYLMLSALQSVIKNSMGIKNTKTEINGKVSGNIIVLDYLREDIIKTYKAEKNMDSKKIIINNGFNIQTPEAQIARRAFKIPDNNKIFFIVNGNLFLGFDTNSKGFAITSSGIYFKNDDKLPGRIDYLRFMSVKVTVKLGCLYIGENKFIIDNVNAVQSVLCELQENIRYLRSIKSGS